MTTTQNRGAQLATQLNLGDVLHWRLHWLTCDLQDLQTKAEASNVRPKRMRVSDEEQTSLVDELAAIASAFQRVHWETKTMLRLDYEDEVTPLFAHVPKYAEFCEQLKKTRAAIEKRVKAAAEAELDAVLSRYRGCFADPFHLHNRRKD